MQTDSTWRLNLSGNKIRLQESFLTLILGMFFKFLNLNQYKIYP